MRGCLRQIVDWGSLESGCGRHLNLRCHLYDRLGHGELLRLGYRLTCWLSEALLLIWCFHGQYIVFGRASSLAIQTNLVHGHRGCLRCSHVRSKTRLFDRLGDWLFSGLLLEVLLALADNLRVNIVALEFSRHTRLLICTSSVD